MTFRSPIRFAVLLFSVLFCVPAMAGIELPDLKALVESGAEVSALFSVDKKPVAALTPEKSVNPASVTKLFSAALALHVLGPNHRVRTEVHTTPDGRLLLVGGGDPELTVRDLDDLAACVAAKTKGTRFSSLIFSTGPFDRKDVPPAFDQKSTTAAYRAGVAGIQVNENSIAVYVGKAKAGQVPSVKVTPDSDYVRVVNQARASAAGKAGSRERKSDPLTVGTSVDKDGRMVVTVSGRSRPGKGAGRSFRVDNPAWNAAAAFVESLRKKKVVVLTTVPERVAAPVESKKICFKPSHSVSQMIVPMLKDSVNQTAETVLRLVGARRADGQVGFDEGAAALRDFLVHEVLAPPESFSFTNGSGLYDANKVSAQVTVALIDWILGHDAIRSDIRKALPVGGVDGTLGGRFKSDLLKGRVRAKTGTLDNAVSLAGWVELADGRNISFAVLVQGDSRLKSSQVRKAIDVSVSKVVRAISAP